jgi:double-strand break repair protein MRE11
MSSSDFAPGPPGADTLRVLVATDNHLGFLEDDPVRCNDSFETFEEILRLAREGHADALFLGGDLFHVNKPSRSTVARTIKLFREYCLGPRDVNMTVRGETRTGKLNFESENLSVDLPVFIIHGNHDDPSREGSSVDALSAIDLLSEAGLVNYFGTSASVETVDVHPLLIEKGDARLKLFGLGWMRDERLHRLFAQNKVVFHTTLTGPEARTERAWFNLLMLHQNREHKGRGAKNSVTEKMIPAVMDLVVFGHEHECVIAPVLSSTSERTHFSQPGSSIATQLTEAEANPKHVCMLEVSHDTETAAPRLAFRELPLGSVRPFVYAEMALANLEQLCETDPDSTKLAAVEAALTDKMDELIREAIQMAREQGGRSDKELKKLKPLVRVRVEHSGFPAINTQRFGAKFRDRVANPAELIYFFRKRAHKDKALPGKNKHQGDELDLDEATNEDEDEDRARRDVEQEQPSQQISRLVGTVLATAREPLTFVPEKEFNASMREFVEKLEPRALEFYINRLVSEQTQFNIKKSLESNVDTFTDELLDKQVRERATAVRAQRNSEQEKKDAEAEQQQEKEIDIEQLKIAAEQRANNAAANAARGDDDDDDDDNDNDAPGSDDHQDDNNAPSNNAKTKANKRAAPAKTKTKPTAKPRASKAKPKPARDDQDDEQEHEQDEQASADDIEDDDDDDYAGAKSKRKRAPPKPKQPRAPPAKKSKPQPNQLLVITDSE